MLSARRFLALVALTWVPRLVAQSAPASTVTSTPPLRVIRAGPTGDANPLAQITVTFDRPIAGSLDRVIDPATVARLVADARRARDQCQAHPRNGRVGARHGRSVRPPSQVDAD